MNWLNRLRAWEERKNTESRSARRELRAEEMEKTGTVSVGWLTYQVQPSTMVGATYQVQPSTAVRMGREAALQQRKRRPEKSTDPVVIQEPPPLRRQRVFDDA